MIKNYMWTGKKKWKNWPISTWSSKIEKYHLSFSLALQNKIHVDSEIRFCLDIWRNGSELFRMSVIQNKCPLNFIFYRECFLLFENKKMKIKFEFNGNSKDERNAVIKWKGYPFLPVGNIHGTQQKVRLNPFYCWSQCFVRHMLYSFTGPF